MADVDVSRRPFGGGLERGTAESMQVSHHVSCEMQAIQTST